MTSAKVGDSLANASVTNPGCAGWHSASYANWMGGYYYYVHNYPGMFSYSYANYYDGYYARGVAVCGTGL